MFIWLEQTIYDCDNFENIRNIISIVKFDQFKHNANNPETDKF